MNSWAKFSTDQIYAVGNSYKFLCKVTGVPVNGQTDFVLQSRAYCCVCTGIMTNTVHSLHCCTVCMLSLVQNVWCEGNLEKQLDPVL